MNLAGGAAGIISPVGRLLLLLPPFRSRSLREREATGRERGTGERDGARVLALVASMVSDRQHDVESETAPGLLSAACTS